MIAKQKNELLVKKIKIFLIESGYSKDALAKSLGFSYGTLQNRLHEPDKFSRWELVELFRIMKLSPDEKAILM